MWVITSYFNSENFQNRYDNYKTFRSKLNVPLLTVELSFNNQFQLQSKDADILLQLSGSSVLWQKERLLNLAIQKIPSSIENIAWIDCDIIFNSQDWAKKAAQALQYNQIIQLFSEIFYLKPNKNEVLESNFLDTKKGLVASLQKLNSNIPNNLPWPYEFHPGFAWAAKKTLIEEHGLYDSMIAGGGDSAMAYALYGKYEASKKHHFLSDLHYQHYLYWAKKINNSVSNKIGFIDEKIYHLWHGNIEDRQYFVRNMKLKELGFNPYHDIQINKNGVWDWHNASEELKRYLIEYFKDRKEDASYLQ